MIAYAESSAVLTWLLGEPQELDVRRVLSNAERVVSSSLTTVECARTLARGVATEQLAPADELAALKLLDVVSSRWAILDMTGAVLVRARGRFPLEPLRTLDALHLATAVVFREALGSLTLVALDDRIRDNGRALGFETAP